MTISYGLVRNQKNQTKAKTNKQTKSPKQGIPSKENVQ